ncbi:MAG: PEP-CTERM sorting domain-containing protein [Deltaproteobacteria bacterium]|nr:PEP-CTERM sorting domain-containing protein [Deltaproteobacteria bacterium]
MPNPIPTLLRRPASVALLVALAISVCTASATAAPFWGTHTNVSVADMFSNFGQNNVTVVDDGPRNPITNAPEGGALTSHSLIDDSTLLDSRGTGPWDRALAEASATINGGAVPAPATLRARAILTGNVSDQAGVTDATAFSTAFASDLFQYTGSVPTNLSITFRMTGSLANNPGDPSGQTLLAAAVAVFADTNYRFETSLDTLRFEGSPLPITKAVDQTTLLRTLHTSGNTITLQRTLTFAVVPGEQFYVWQRLSAWAAGDARAADAYSTLTATFSQPDLVQNLAVIPEPSTALMLGLGLALVALRRPSGTR